MWSEYTVLVAARRSIEYALCIVVFTVYVCSSPCCVCLSVPRIQFLAIEIARNREGCNDGIGRIEEEKKK